MVSSRGMNDEEGTAAPHNLQWFLFFQFRRSGRNAKGSALALMMIMMVVMVMMMVDYDDDEDGGDADNR